MTLIAMGSTTVKRARKGADAEYYEMTAIPSVIHVGADGKVDNDVTIRLWHVKGASRTEVTTASNSKVWPHVTSESVGSLDDDGSFPYSLSASDTYLASDVANGDSYVVCTVAGVAADKLIIPIVRDGQGISTADIMFTLAITNTTAPLDLQFNDAKQTKTLAKDFFTSDNKDKYLWQGTKVVASDGSVSWTGKICLGKISDLQSSNEEYMLTTSNTDVPPLPGNTGADWNPVFKPKAGYYLWEITKIVYACDSSVSYTTPQCIGYFSKNGVAGAYYQTQYGLSNSRTSHAVVNWKDMMPTPTDDYPYVWQRTRLCTPTESSTTYGDWLYVCLTGEKGDPGIPGEKASYYEARFVNQDFDVRVDNDHLNGVLYAVFDLRVYHVVGSDATEVSGDGVTVNFSFRNADGIEKATGTASYNSTTKLISYSNKSLQDPYFGEKIDRITSCYYSISLPSSMGGSTRDGVISVQFYAPSAFEHSDTLFKSIFAKGSKFSQLVQNVDGIFTRVQRLETNMLMGTTTGLGWTHEKTCSESSYSFDASLREFTIINYFPAFRDGITSESTAYSTLKSAVLQVIPGKTYILSFKANVGDKVRFNVGLRYGTTNAVSDDSAFYDWNNKKATHDDKAMEVLVPTKGSDGRYFVVFVAKSGYDYMQVMFINAVDGNNYAVTSSTTSSDSTTIYEAWPYSDTKNHTTSSSTTVSKDGAVRTTVSNVHVYTGSSTNYGAFTQTTVETVTPTYLYITEPQLEEATRDNIADIEPSDYKSYQNVVESYIKQTADSIEIRASKIIFKGETVINGKFVVDEDGNVTLNYLTANNATINGVINAVSGKIGGWQIDGTSLKSDGQGAAINIEQDGYNFARLGNIGEDSFLYVRMDKDTSMQGHWDCAATFNTYGSNGTALNLLANSKGYALESYGRVNLCSRNAESVLINHLALKTDSNTDSFDKGGAQLHFGKGGVSIENESFSPNVIITNRSYTNISLPANPNKGDLRIVVQGSSDKVTITDPNGHWFQHGAETARTSVNSDTNGQWTFFLYDGFYWQVVYCNGRPW